MQRRRSCASEEHQAGGVRDPFLLFLHPAGARVFGRRTWGLGARAQPWTRESKGFSFFFFPPESNGRRGGEENQKRQERATEQAKLACPSTDRTGWGPDMLFGGVCRWTVDGPSREPFRLPTPGVWWTREQGHRARWGPGQASWVRACSVASGGGGGSAGVPPLCFSLSPAPSSFARYTACCKRNQAAAIYGRGGRVMMQHHPSVIASSVPQRSAVSRLYI